MHVHNVLDADDCSSMYRMRMIAFGCHFRWTVADRMLMHHVCHRCGVLWFVSNMTGAGCKKLLPNQLHSCNDVFGFGRSLLPNQLLSCNDVSSFGRSLLNHWPMMLLSHPLSRGCCLVPIACMFIYVPDVDDCRWMPFPMDCCGSNVDASCLPSPCVLVCFEHDWCRM